MRLPNLAEGRPMEDRNQDETPNDRGWWDAVQRGELPPDLTSVHSYVQREALAFFLASLAFAFVEVQVEVKQRYAPAVPPFPYADDLMRWFQRHLAGAGEAGFQKLESDEQREAVGRLAADHLKTIGRLLAERLRVEA